MSVKWRELELDLSPEEVAMLEMLEKLAADRGMTAEELVMYAEHEKLVRKEAVVKRRRLVCRVCKKRRTSVRKVASMPVAACEKCRNLDLPFQQVSA